MEKPIELTPGQFKPALLEALVGGVVAEAGRKFDSAHFFKTWRHWMEIGVARTWYAPGCVLGAVFSDDVFSAKAHAQVVFWFCAPEHRGTGVSKAVFLAFEKAAKIEGYDDIQAAAHGAINPLKRESGYLRHGFVQTEVIFTKELT